MFEKQSAKTFTNGANNPPKICDMTLRKVHAKPKTCRRTFAKSAMNTTALFMLANGLCKMQYDRFGGLFVCTAYNSDRRS